MTITTTRRSQKSAQKAAIYVEVGARWALRLLSQTSISSSLNAPTSHNFLVPTPRIGLSIGWFVSLFVRNEISQESTIAAFSCKIFKKDLDRSGRDPGYMNSQEQKVVWTESVSGETFQNDQPICRLSSPNARVLRRHRWSGMKLSVQFQHLLPFSFQEFYNKLFSTPSCC